MRSVCVWTLCACCVCVRTRCACADKSMCPSSVCSPHPLVALRLSPYFRYCKQCCSEHECMLSLQMVFWILWINTQSGTARSYGIPMLNFFEESPCSLPQGPHSSRSHQQYMRVSFSLHPHQTCHCLFCFVFYNNHSGRGGSDL